ncbi:hypothetical protein [Streptomyces azureus]
MPERSPSGAESHCQGSHVSLSKPTAALSHEIRRILETDGCRAQLAVYAGGRVPLRSKRGTELGRAFPEVVAGAAQLPDAGALDGELVVRREGRPAFERLQDRLQRRGAAAALAVAEWPVHFVAFDLLRLSGTNMTLWPYRWHRAALKSLYAVRRLSAPWALCQSTRLRRMPSGASTAREGGGLVCRSRTSQGSQGHPQRIRWPIFADCRLWPFVSHHSSSSACTRCTSC